MVLPLPADEGLEASSLVRVQQRITTPTEAYGAIQTGQLLAETYAQIVDSDTIRRRIFSIVQGTIPNDTGQIAITASPVQRLDLLRISVRGPDPARGRDRRERRARALAGFIRQTGTLRDQIVPIDRAELPRTAVSPRLKLDLALAVLLGLIFNSALALVLELVGDRVRHPEELEELFGLPVLATVPSVKLRPAPPEIRGRTAVAFLNEASSRVSQPAREGGNVS